MRIAVASGKGGTGKTLLATNLAWLLAREGQETTYVDCDVEAPNGHLFLKPQEIRSRRQAVLVPALKTETCSGCGLCQAFCAFNAIIVVGGNQVLVFSELCHSCGGCVQVCRERALEEVPLEVGTIDRGRVGTIGYMAGRLDVGQPRGVPLIEALVKEAPTTGTVIIDAPPGTSCNAVAAVRGVDHVLLVTEPTPFGLHDLRLAVEMCRSLGLAHSALINRSDLGDGAVKEYLDKESIPIVAEIPFDRGLAAAYSKGALAAQQSELLRTALTKLAAHLQHAEARKGAA